ncbi:unnamed protein product [Brassica napus]|uniref:(rape) hypothetical protein n=1 Tax=Brassica napus TaxID=3708 RepID=A0A816X7Q5_BRANA|nr:unnamed protein product [Brassica napus]
MYPSREGVVATDNSRRDRNRTDLYSMTKPHSSVDNSYSFSRSIPLLLMDMSADEPIILQNEVLLYAILTKKTLEREKESLALAHGGGGPRVDDLRKDGRASYLREFERRRENLHARYKERERERERQRAKDRKRIPTARPTSRDPKERTPVPKTVSRDTPSSSLRRDSQHREASIRRHSPIRPIRSDW